MVAFENWWIGLEQMTCCSSATTSFTARALAAGARPVACKEVDGRHGGALGNNSQRWGIMGRARKAWSEL